MVQKVKDIYKNWLPVHRNLPRLERFGLGLRIDILLLDLLELLRKATYASIPIKIPILEECLSKTDSLRFFVQIMWENKLIPNNQFTLLGEEIESVGKNIGGWKKELLKKLPP